MEFNVFLNGGIQPKRYRTGGVGNWSGHLPFAYDLIAAAKPGLLVELGTHHGESYFGFCQSIAEQNIPCSCYAVDSWTGEAHADFYDESTYLDVSAYNQAYYSDFSYLLRTTFDIALSNFADESIDLLHIDGLHTYEAVSNELHSWLPKVKPGGIILMHDITARHSNFCVWNVWQELAATGSHFAFFHNWGLGVFRKPGGPTNTQDLFTALFDSSQQVQKHVRKFYALCAIKLEYEYNLEHSTAAPNGKVLAQIYTAGTDGYSGDRCINAYVTQALWDHLSIDLPAGIGIGPVRLDPSDHAGVVDIAGIVLRRLVDGKTLWSASTYSELAMLELGGNLELLEGGDHSFCRFISHGANPQVFLPILESTQFDQPLSLEIWLRVQTDVRAVLGMLQNTRERSLAKERERSLAKELEAAIDDRNVHSQQSAKMIAERDSLLATCHKLQSELYIAKSDLRRIELDKQKRLADSPVLSNPIAAPTTTLFPDLGNVRFWANPPSMDAAQDSGVRVIHWSVPGVSKVEIRLESPRGKLFATGTGVSQARTGPWARPGLRLYLQDASTGDSTSPDQTLAVLILG